MNRTIKHLLQELPDDLQYKIVTTADAIEKANPGMDEKEALLITSWMDRDGVICLPVGYNPPEGWVDVTTAEQESKNPSYRFYTKGRD